MRDLILLTDWFGFPDQPAESPEDDGCRGWEDEEPQSAGDLEEMIDERIDERIDDAEACCEWEADRRNERDRDEGIMHRDREGD